MANYKRVDADKLDADLEFVADAIREVSGTTAKLSFPLEMEAAIRALEKGGGGGGGVAGETIVLAEKGYLFAGVEGGGYMSMPNIDSILVAFELVADKEYRVVWDGTSYTCTAMRIDDPAGVLIGNPAMLGFPQDSGEPFLIGVLEDGTPAIVTTEGTGDTTTHTVGVYTECSGGGSGEDVKYVTFMSEDGETELYKKAVFSGDNCMNPVSMGWMNTPTKESTNTEVFSYSGWSLTAGGAASASALSVVTEDRTVYVAYTASTRYYTVRFFDGNTLLHTAQVEYGGSASYAAEKDGYAFDGWQPSSENITADTDCYAQWTAEITFANATWAQIAAISESGQASSRFSIGDTKTMTFNGNETITVEIVGFKHDALANGTGYAGISVMCKTLPSITYSQTGAINVYTSLGEMLLPMLPNDLRAVVKTITKECDTSIDTGYNTGKDLSAAVWIPSATELGFSASDFGSYTGNMFNELGAKYAGVTKNAARFGAKEEWFTRTYIRNGGNLQLAGRKYISSISSYVVANINATERDSLKFPFGFCV